jgi:two-component system, OmpR family, response regulator
MRILIIEDDKKLAKIIANILKDEKIHSDIYNDGDTGLEAALRGAYEVAIIDWMLPGRDGPSICRAIRAARLEMGLLLLTARGQVEDRVAGLDSGADDYLAKPFSFDELLARIRALSRRTSAAAGDAWELRVGNLVMDLRARSLRRADKVIELSKTEWELLELLMRQTDRVITRQKILDCIWSYDASVKQELVDVYISYLRKKLEVDGSIDPIQTIRGVGYMLESKNA